MGMNGHSPAVRRWLIAAVLGHLAIALVHGAAHAGAAIPMGAAANLFVVTVILAGPLVGLGLSRRDPRIGASIIAATMAASLVFGVVHHFVMASPDHVAYVEAAWRPLFGVTAVLLAATEVLGAALGMQVLTERNAVP